MAEEKKEVNVDVEKIELKPSEPEEGEEIITKLEDIEEKGTPSESSSEEKPSETKEGEEGDKEKLITQIRKEEPSKPEEDKGFVEPSDEKPGEIKSLPDESPREHALRLEVTRLKRANLEKRKEELLGDVKPEKPSGITNTQFGELNEDEKSLLAQYDPKELSTFEKILDVLGKKHGWVKKGDLDSTTRSQISNDVFDDFLESHPEYSPENDKDNVLWNTFKSEFHSGLYNTQPKNPRDLKRIFNKIHQGIFGVKSDDGLKKINAQKEKLKVVSHSGGSAAKGQSSPKGTRLTPEQKSHLKGFTEKELGEM